MPSSRPNIVCFITDQQRADHLGCYGNPDIQTPHIDRLAAEGIRFDESYVANPVCMPNRASLFTGRYPKTHRLRENGLTLSLNERTLPEVLQQNGYQTMAAGKIHLSPFDMRPGLADAPHECYEGHAYWDEHNEMPTPYYGLERVYFVGGHGSYCFGQYKNDLQREHPGVWEKLQKENAAEPPSGARESWKASIPEEHHYNTRIADHSIDFIEQRDTDNPFFLWCSFPDPHHPYGPPKPWCDMYDPEAIAFDPARREGEFDDLPPYFTPCREGRIGTGGLAGDLRKVTDDHFREIVAHTYGMISMVDRNIGRVMACLEAQGILDNTIVVFLSDHADLMGDHWLINKGPFLFRQLVRVPTVWRVPGGLSGAACNGLVSAVDFAPTLLDLASVEAPPGVQGTSYRGALTGEGYELTDAVYIEYDESYLDDRLRQIRTPNWALTWYAANDYGLLFDRREDPDELHNLWDAPQYREVKQHLLELLLRRTCAADDWLPEKKVHA
jgi:arylsulfatase A-like enzyme